MSKAKLGIIGLGGISQVVHLPILSKMSNCKIESICDVDSNKLKFIGDKFHISDRHEDYQNMLKNDEIDAVIVATPTNKHHDIVIDALQAGKQVLVEKPVAISSSEAHEMELASTKYGKQVMVGMNLRFRPDAMLLKSLINSHELGEIFYVKCGWLNRKSSIGKWFLEKKKAGGGVLTDLGILLVDLALWLVDFPSVNTVSVQKFNHLAENVEDSAVGLIRCTNKTVINFDVSWSMASEYQAFGLSVFGQNGTAKMNPLRAYKTVDNMKIDYTLPASGNSKNLFKKSYENELKHFVGAINSGSKFFSSIDEAVQRMQLLESIYESASIEKELNIGK